MYVYRVEMRIGNLQAAIDEKEEKISIVNNEIEQISHSLPNLDAISDDIIQ